MGNEDSNIGNFSSSSQLTKRGVKEEYSTKSTPTQKVDVSAKSDQKLHYMNSMVSPRNVAARPIQKSR